MQIFIHGHNNKTLSFNCCKDTKIKHVKHFIFKKTGIPSTWQYFLVNCKSVYDDNSSLEDNNIDNETTIHLMLKWHGVGCQCPSCFKKGILLRNGKHIGCINSN